MQENKHKINNYIREKEIRLSGQNLQGLNIQSGIINTSTAIEIANDRGMDLIMVNEKSYPPVCYIMKYTDFIYKQKKKKKENQGTRIKTKTITLSPNITEWDLNRKRDNAIRFLIEGHNIKIVLRMKRREFRLKDQAELKMLTFIENIEEFGKIITLPKLAGNQFTCQINTKTPNKKDK